MIVKQKIAALILIGIFSIVTKVQAQMPGMTQEHMVMPANIVWENVSPAIPPGAQSAVLDGDPRVAGPYTIRLKLPANYTIKPHMHPDDEHITIIEGSCYMGMGDKYDEKTAKAMPTAAYTSIKMGTSHYLFTKKPCIVQVHGMGPWGITYINPGDDPRNKK